MGSSEPPSFLSYEVFNNTTRILESNYNTYTVTESTLNSFQQSLPSIDIPTNIRLALESSCRNEMPTYEDQAKYSGELVTWKEMHAVIFLFRLYTSSRNPPRLLHSCFLVNSRKVCNHGLDGQIQVFLFTWFFANLTPTRA